MSRIKLYFVFFLLLSSCGQSDKSVENTNSKILFEEIKPIQEQLNPNIQINLSKLVKDNSFVNNITNNNGNINFEPTFEKKKTFKFSKIKQFNSIDTDILFIENNDLIYENFETLWKANHYSKKERKLNPILYFNYIDNRLLVVDTLSNIFSINLENGQLIWKKESITPFNSNVTVQADKFITVDFDNVIRCFSVIDGNELWNFKTENTFIKSQKKLSIVIKDDNVYSLNNLGDLTALNVNDGSLVWQIGFVIAKNKIYLSTDNGRILIINLTNSETEKVIKFNNEKISRPFINNANIFLIKNNGIIRSN